MKHLPYLFVAALLAACQGSPESPDQDQVPDSPPAFAEETGEWVPLFNGVDINDWIVRNGQHSYTVEDGVIVGTTVPGEPNGFLCTPRDYSDFILEFEVMVDSLLNSGVQFRSLSTPDYRDGRVHGYQVEIDAELPINSGGIYDEARRAVFLHPTELQHIEDAWNHDGWNHYRVEAIGPNLRTWVNGVSAVAIVDSVTASGFIGLQVHETSHPEPLQVRWRNLRIMEL